MDDQVLQVANVAPAGDPLVLDFNFDLGVLAEQNLQGVPDFDNLFVVGQVLVLNDLYLADVDPCDEDFLKRRD